MSHINESAVLMENNLTQPNGVDIGIHLLLLCCGKFCVPARESFIEIPVRRCKRLGTADLNYFKTVSDYSLR